MNYYLLTARRALVYKQTPFLLRPVTAGLGH